MSKEEITIRLIELYYNSIEIFRARCMSLNDLLKKYCEALQEIEKQKDSDIK